MSIKNSVTLVGNVGQTPELKYTKDGKAYMNVSIAVNKSYKDDNGDKKTITNWFQFTLWEKRAETMSKYLTKGKQIAIEGELYTRKRDVDGTDVTLLEIKVNELEMFSSPSDKAEDKKEAKGKGKKKEDEAEYVDDNVSF